MVGDGTLFHGDMALEVGLDFVWGLPIRQAKAVGYAEHVGVHGYYGLVVEDGGHYVGGLAMRLSVSEGITEWKSLTSFRAMSMRWRALLLG